MYKAVIFDFDGTIANTMKQNYEAWKISLNKYGFMLDEATYYYEEGKTPKMIVSQYTKDENIINRIIKEKEKIFLENYEIKIFSGVVDLLSKLKKLNIKLALVTGGVHERVNYILEVSGLIKYFDCIITANDVTLGKPNKEPYIKALNQLNLQTSNCIVVENAPMGIQSAKSANIFCIALETTLSKDNLTNADLILNSYRELTEYLLESLSDA